MEKMSERLPFQQDMFFVEPSLSISRPHRENEAALRHDECYWERHELEPNVYWEVGIGRTADGFYFSAGYRWKMGGMGGPVFVNGTPYPDFSSAREAAIGYLLSRLSACYDSQSQDQRLRLAKSIRENLGLS